MAHHEEGRDQARAPAAPAAVNRHVPTRSEVTVRVLDHVPECGRLVVLGNRHVSDRKPTNAHTAALGALDQIGDAEQLELVILDQRHEHDGPVLVAQGREGVVKAPVPNDARHDTRRALPWRRGQTEMTRDALDRYLFDPDRVAR